MIPIKQLFKKINGVIQPFYPITHEQAVFDGGGRKLSEKLATYEENLSDAFSEEKTYAVGDYVIYQNRLYKFTSTKEVGAFDGTKVIPCSVMAEIWDAENDSLTSSHNINPISKVYKKCGIVNLTCLLTLTSNVSDYGVIANIPYDYRPTQYQYILSKYGICIITENGAIQLHPNTLENNGQTIQFSTSYILNI